MIPCNICEAKLRDNYNLETHLKANHICKFCEKQFRDKVTLKAHVKACFVKDKNRRYCKSCGNAFNHKGNHEAHEKICGIKKENVNLVCHICDPNKSFSKKSALDNHLRSHEKEKPLIVPNVQRSFPVKIF